MRRIMSALGLLAGVALASQDARAEVAITVDKSTQRMTVVVDGEQRFSWPVSTGMAGYTTPDGAFTPSRLAREHFSREWDNAPMPHSIFFTERGPCHSRQPRDGAPGHAGLAWLRPAGAGPRRHPIRARAGSRARPDPDRCHRFGSDRVRVSRGSGRGGDLPPLDGVRSPDVGNHGRRVRIALTRLAAHAAMRIRHVGLVSLSGARPAGFRPAP